MKKIILTADDLGISKSVNLAITKLIEKTLLNKGMLTSVCIMTNAKYYKDALDSVVKKYPDFNYGLHLNSNECNSSFGFVRILFKSFNKSYLEKIEKEFKSQIEQALNDGIKITYLNSHVHIHSIPNIFKIVAKLADEYNINSIRMQNEKFYFSDDDNVQKTILRHLNISYFANIIKHFLLKIFTYFNQKYLNENYSKKIKTNNNFLGILYSLNMDEDTIFKGIKSLEDNNSSTEIILHPTINTSDKKKYKEFLTLFDVKFKKKLEDSGFELINWNNV